MIIIDVTRLVWESTEPDMLTYYYHELSVLVSISRLFYNVYFSGRVVSQAVHHVSTINN